MAEPNKIARRSFFAGLGALAAAGIAVRFSPRVATPVAEAPPVAPDSKGYRLSEHVKKYYRTTSV